MTAFVLLIAKQVHHGIQQGSLIVRFWLDAFFTSSKGALCTLINYGFCPLTRVEFQRDCAPWLNEIHSLSYVLSAAAALLVRVASRLLALKIELTLSLLSGHHKMKRPF